MYVPRRMDLREAGRTDEAGLLGVRYVVPAVGAFHLVSEERAAWSMGKERAGSKNISAGS